MNTTADKIIGRWLLLGVAMLLFQVLLGGITRLTGSGLSITEWEPIMGFLPPLHEQDWLHAFEKYKQIPQAKLLNNDFGLHDFKFIFFWEWLHRFWARFIGIAFILPFIYFLIKGYIQRKTILELLTLFLLGLLLATIGWIMVSSGFEKDNLYVNHIKLAMHFVLAMVVISAVFWVALNYLTSSELLLVKPSFKIITSGLLFLLFIQLSYGAFMAGLKAASAAPTWPSINGSYFPVSVLHDSITNNPINVHFIHRMLAYFIAIYTLIWYYISRKQVIKNEYTKWLMLPVILVLLQILLGVGSVLLSQKQLRNSFGVFESFALMHQVVGMLFALSMVWVLNKSTRR